VIKSNTFLEVTRRGRIFASDGSLAYHAPVPFAIDQAVVVGEDLYLRGHSSHDRLQRALHRFRVGADGLEQAGSFHPYDERRDLYPFLPRITLGAGAGRLWASDLFDFRITVYDPEGEAAVSWVLPGGPGEPHPLWNRERHELTDEDRSALRRSVHRVRSLYHYGQGIYLVEVNLRQADEEAAEPVGPDSTRLPGDELTIALVDTEAGVLHRFRGLLPFPGDGVHDRLAVDGVVGVYPGGLVALLDEPAKVARFEAQYPQLGPLDYALGDNPVLLFLRLDPFDELVRRLGEVRREGEAVGALAVGGPGPGADRHRRLEPVAELAVPGSGGPVER